MQDGEDIWQWFDRCGKAAGWTFKGKAAMDTAALVISDPSYIYDRKMFPKTYDEFLPKLLGLYEKGESEIKFPNGQSGGGVVVDFGGDGFVDVFTKEKSGATTQVIIA